MLYIIRFLTLLFVFCTSLFMIGSNFFVGIMIAIFNAILVTIVFVNYTNFVKSKFGKVGRENFSNNYKDSNLYIARNYASAMYVDETGKKICFFSPTKNVSQFNYSALTGVEFDKSKKILNLFFTSESKRLNVPFFYNQDDFGHLNSMMHLILE